MGTSWRSKYNRDGVSLGREDAPLLTEGSVGNIDNAGEGRGADGAALLWKTPALGIKDNSSMVTGENIYVYKQMETGR